MNRRFMWMVAAMALCWGAVAVAQQTMTFDWEDGVSTALGTFNNVVLENTAEQAQSGSRSLKYIKSPNTGSTPQVYIWWITGCADGDVIDASFYMYDTSAGVNPSGRIWAHYTSDPSDVNSYSGSASGSATYTAGTGWEQLAYQWTFASSGDDEGFVVEARIYATAGGDSVIYVDNAYISTTSSTAVIHNAAGDVPVELTSFIASVGMNEVELRWSTASEIDNLGFNVFRSAGIAERVVITPELVLGAGTTMEPQHYSFLDRHVTSGVTYRYWLEQVDFQGTTEVFGPIVASVPVNLAHSLSLAVSPVPVQDGAEVRFQVPRDGVVDVVLYDVQGRMISRLWHGSATAGSNVVRWERGSTPAGLYMLRIATGFETADQPLVLR